MPQGTLFDIRIDSITYDMVDAFLAEGHRENVRIEYKAPDKGVIPDSALDSVTAMSNSVGGVILIGVADEKNLPKMGGWPSLPRTVGRGDQVDSALSKIESMIVPRPATETRFLAPDSASPTGILLIRVLPGSRPPYWCTSKGVLIRHGDQDRIADLATIEYLIERRTKGSYTIEQAQERNWFAPLGASGPTDPTIVRAVMGPVDNVTRPPLSRTLDSWAWHILLGQHTLIWRPSDAMIYPSFGEDFIRLLARSSKSNVPYLDVAAYSDGVTTWHIPLGPGAPMSTEGLPDLEAFRSAELQRTLYGMGALGIAWAQEAIPDYQGALSYEVEVHNLKGKYIRSGDDERGRSETGFGTQVWRGAFTLADADDYLSELKTLYYRFLRSGQAPALVDDADKWFNNIAIEWKSTLG